MAVAATDGRIEALTTEKWRWPGQQQGFHPCIGVALEDPDRSEWEFPRLRSPKMPAGICPQVCLLVDSCVIRLININRHNWRMSRCCGGCFVHSVDCFLGCSETSSFYKISFAVIVPISNVSESSGNHLSRWHLELPLCFLLVKQFLLDLRVSDPTFGSLIHCEFILHRVKNRGLASFILLHRAI